MINFENRITPEKITQLAENEVFVFGSNKAGRHGKGAAKQALEFGAQIGIGSGCSRQTYAIATKNAELKVYPLHMIKIHVMIFMNYVECYPENKYLVTAIGCGLAGYTPEQIAPLFRAAVEIENIHLPASFWEILNKGE